MILEYKKVFKITLSHLKIYEWREEKWEGMGKGEWEREWINEWIWKWIGSWYDF